MGQQVNQQLGMDPDYLRSQILRQREQGFQQIQNPQQQVAARMGSMLGGGIANLLGGQGFFDVNDPLLTKVTQIQGIYNQVASQVDPATNPEQFYTTLSAAYKDAGLGQQALMAAQEGQKQQKESLSLESARFDLFAKNPELLEKEIIKAENAGDEEKVAQLAGIQKRYADMRDLEKRTKEAQIDKDKAAAAAARATAEGKDIVYMPDGLGGKVPYERKGTTLIPLKVEGGSASPAAKPGTGKGKYNPQTGRVEFK